MFARRFLNLSRRYISTNKHILPDFFDMNFERGIKLYGFGYMCNFTHDIYNITKESLKKNKSCNKEINSYVIHDDVETDSLGAIIKSFFWPMEFIKKGIVASQIYLNK